MFNKSAKLKWKDKIVSCPVTFELICDIEESGLNILLTSIKLDQGNIPPVTLVSKIYSWLLSSAGVIASPEEVYTVILASPVDHIDMMKSAKDALDLFYPVLDSDGSGDSTGTKKK